LWNILEKTESTVKQTPLEVFKKEVNQSDNILDILKGGIQRVSFNDKKYILDERKIVRNKNGVKNAKQWKRKRL